MAEDAPVHVYCASGDVPNVSTIRYHAAIVYTVYPEFDISVAGRGTGVSRPLGAAEGGASPPPVSRKLATN